ncbi:MAG: nicotinate (nicotinamide) nucleotide adenylyltransferase [Myxococcota bacterium]
MIYGGSFDPPHVGHQMACLYLLEALGAASVWVVPAFVHAFDKSLSTFEDRVEMCRRMAAFFDDRVRVEPIERELDQGGRTLALIRALEARYPDRRFALAVGSDIISERTRWYRWEEIEATVPVVVVGRGGYDEAGGAPIELPEVSSTLVRERAKQGKTLIGLVPLAVAQFIEERGLYRGEAAE